MPDRSKMLAAELYDLWKAGTFTLPDVAVVYRAAAGAVRDTQLGEYRAFHRTRESRQYGAACQPLEALRRLLADILDRAAGDLDSCARALLVIKDEYAATDAAASATLAAMIEERIGGLPPPPGDEPVIPIGVGEGGT